MTRLIIAMLSRNPLAEFLDQLAHSIKHWQRDADHGCFVRRFFPASAFSFAAAHLFPRLVLEKISGAGRNQRTAEGADEAGFLKALCLKFCDFDCGGLAVQALFSLDFNRFHHLSPCSINQPYTLRIKDVMIVVNRNQSNIIAYLGGKFWKKERRAAKKQSTEGE